MSAPYDSKSIPLNIYGDKRSVEGEIIAILHAVFDERRLKLIDTKSRVLKLNEIHELMITDESAEPGGRADRVRAICFFEITISGLIVVCDDVWVEDRFLGKLTGYDLTHMPNHMNILVKSENLKEPEIRIGEKIRFNKS